MPKRNTQTFKRAMNEYINLYLKNFLAIDSMYLGVHELEFELELLLHVFSARTEREKTHTQ